MVKLGDVFPNFECDTTVGKIKLTDWLAGSWGILFSHPADYTPVCTTELGRAALMSGEFEKRGVKMIGLSCDSVESHHGWIKDIQAYNELQGSFPYPIIDDSSREISVQLGMLDEVAKDAEGLPLSARAVFVIGPDKKMKLSLLYPATTGRDFNEILRAIDSLQLTATKKVATPVNWRSGDRCMVPPNLSTEEARKVLEDVKIHDVPSKKEYLRTANCPK